MDREIEEDENKKTPDGVFTRVMILRGHPSFP